MTSRFDTLHDALRLLREQRGYSQRRVADALGVEASAVGSWERGKRPPPLDRFFQLADLYDLDLADIDDALEMAGSPPRRGRRQAIADADLTPRRLARLLLDRRGEAGLDPAENELVRLLDALFALADRLRSQPRE